MKKFIQWLLPKSWITVQHIHECKHVYMDMSEMTDLSNALQVVIVHDDSDKISEVLGITEERYNYLNKQSKIATIETDTITDALTIVSKECKHPNELVMCTISIWNYAHPHSGLGGLLSAIMTPPPGE